MLVKKALEYYDFFDGSVIRHGFTKYFRDYEIEAQDMGGNRLLFLFRGCVETKYSLKLPVNGFSVDDVFINYDDWQNAGNPPGFVWDVWATAYPGLEYVDNSATAKSWEDKVGIKFHEIILETNIFSLNLIFHDLAVQEI